MDKKPDHKEVHIKSSIYKNRSYSTENSWIVSRDSSDRDTFVSTVSASTGSSKIKINILYSGDHDKVPADLLENLLCVADSSYNPSRPFRWYKGHICADTNYPDSIVKCRNESFEKYLKLIDSPEKIFIYEIEIR